uniref:Receptor kinase-like protein Xa21 n=1 Tax=Tanacetum cinerariifolium TaxID=118510 RepID=A0A6L2KQJ4_TANCI|nr:receptor kinase-like protein Xa21 [Tanacetum cinerariifolium]
MEEAVRSSHLAHLVKEIKQGNPKRDATKPTKKGKTSAKEKEYMLGEVDGDHTPKAILDTYGVDVLHRPCRHSGVIGAIAIPFTIISGLSFEWVSYNILAQSLATSRIFPHSPSPCLRKETRMPVILDVLKNLNADILCLQNSTTLNGTHSDVDRVALLAVKSLIREDPQNVTSSWNHSLNFCQWQGVTCSRRHQRVILLDLSSRGLVGSLSPWIGNMSFLRGILLQNNSLNGEIPEQLGRLFRLQDLHLNNNSFDGSIPRSLSNCSNLNILHLGLNKLVGRIPYEFGSLTNLRVLIVHRNNIAGGVPSFIGNLTMLDTLSLGGCRLLSLGIILVISFGAISLVVAMVTFAFFCWRRRKGNIPETLGNLSSLIELHIGMNKFNGTIPSSIGNCKKLIALTLEKNRLIGIIPKSLFGITSLSISLNLGGNYLSGQLPVEMGNDLTNLNELILAENRLSGELPSSIGSCSSLQSLDIGGNFFVGSLPSTLGSLRALANLDLSFNNFTGLIPRFLESLPLESLNMSFNGFEGEVSRKGVFANVSAISIEGNSGLCGGVRELRLPKCSSNRPKGSNKLSLATGRAGLRQDCLLKAGSILITFLFTRVFLRIHNMVTPDLFSGIVAIKVLNLHRQGGSKSFISECEALRNARHRNLVKVISCCSGSDFEGNEFKALVYEFQHNGSLDRWLHPSDTIGNMQIEILQSEILRTYDSSSLGVRGTIGYAPPEYGLGSKVSTSGDIYSYGVLLLEMVTSKRPTDPMFNEGINLHNYVNAAMDDRLVEIVDPILLRNNCSNCALSTNKNGEETVSLQIEACLRLLLELGVACSKELPQHRIDISSVIQELHLIKDVMLGYSTG